MIGYAVELVTARGHPNISARHRTTLEVTMDTYLTPRGDCIVGIGADKSASAFSEDFKRIARSRDAVILAILASGPYHDVVRCRGDPGLVFGDPRKIILRRSNYIEPATIGVECDKAARDIDRNLVAALRDQGSLLHLVLVTFRFTARSME